MQQNMEADIDHEDGDHGDDAQSKKRKRNRAVLSCVPCKQRKVKCSRTIPCENCLKRDIAADCRWADKDFEPPKQVFALESVLDSLRDHFEDRIRHLEDMMNVKPGSTSKDVVKRALADAYSSANYSPQAGSSKGANGASTASNSASLPFDARTYSASPEQSYMVADEAAGAAFALEVLAGGDAQGLPSDVKPALNSNKLLTMKEFAKSSILEAEPNPRLEGNPRIPLLSFLSRRTITDSVLACVQTKDRSQLLFDYYFRSSGWIFGSISKGQFFAEHDAFWEHVSMGRRDFDLPWLGTFCIVLATALQAKDDADLGEIQAEDLYQLSRLCLEFAEWRRNPSRRVVQTLFLSAMYLNGQNDMNGGRTYFYAALSCVQALGWHQLGDDPSIMPKPDVSWQEGSLMAREIPVRLWWDIVTQDWIGLLPHRHPAISPKSFTTCWPRNFNDDQIENALWDAEVLPSSVPTDSLLQIGKTYTAVFVRKIYDLGLPPADDNELNIYYQKMLALDNQYVSATEKYMKISFPNHPDTGGTDWRLLVGRSGIACRRMRAHRPFMVCGYRQPARFGQSTQACVESALTVLDLIRQLQQLDVPHTAIWFLSRHLLAAITTIFIDILHDADVGVSPAISDRKLVNIPHVVEYFKNSESSSVGSGRELGRRGRLLVQALQDAKEARRKTRGSKEDYGRVLREIGTSMKASSSAQVTPSFSHSSASPHTPHTAPITWLDDPETRRLLSSLGLLDSNNQVQNTSNFLDPQLASMGNDDFAGLTTSLDFANNFNTGFEMLESGSLSFNFQ